MISSRLTTRYCSKSASGATALDGHGAVWIEANGAAVTINGTISVNAARGGGSGGGSGGSVFLTYQDLRASVSARLYANGGNSGAAGMNPSGAGGGGRIAVWIGTVTEAQRRTLFADGIIPRAVIGSTSSKYQGIVSATNGINTSYPSGNGLSGTVVFIVIPASAGTMISIR
ncbi:MAG: hypothetical protein WCL16_10765 [bacterium]